jgi:nitroreductase
MCSDVSEQKNMYLDQILADRRSYRMFRQEVPEVDDIRRILHAGLLAPWEGPRITSAVSL